MNTDPVGDSVCVFSCVENLSAVSMSNARHETQQVYFRMEYLSENLAT